MFRGHVSFQRTNTLTTQIFCGHFWSRLPLLLNHRSWGNLSNLLMQLPRKCRAQNYSKMRSWCVRSRCGDFNVLQPKSHFLWVFFHTSFLSQIRLVTQFPMSKMVVSSMVASKAKTMRENSGFSTSTCLKKLQSVRTPVHPYLHSMALVVSETYQNSHLTPGCCERKRTLWHTTCSWLCLCCFGGWVWNDLAKRAMATEKTDEDITILLDLPTVDSKFPATSQIISGYIPDNTKHTTCHEIVKALVCFAVHHEISHHQGLGSLRPAGFLHMEKDQVVYPREMTCQRSKICWFVWW